MHGALVTLREIAKDQTTTLVVPDKGSPHELGPVLGPLLQRMVPRGLRMQLLHGLVSEGAYMPPDPVNLLDDLEFRYNITTLDAGFVVLVRRRGDLLFDGTLSEFRARFDPSFVPPVPREPEAGKSEIASLLGPVPRFLPRMRQAISDALCLTSHHVEIFLKATEEGILLDLEWKAWPGNRVCLTKAPAPLIAFGFVEIVFTGRRCTARIPQSVPAWSGGDLGFLEVGTSRRRGGSIAAVKEGLHHLRVYGNTPTQLRMDDTMNFMTKDMSLPELQRIVEHHVYGISF
jgi:hypothetical protein